MCGMRWKARPSRYDAAVVSYHAVIAAMIDTYANDISSSTDIEFSKW